MTATEFQHLRALVPKLTVKQQEALRQELERQAGRRELLRRIKAVEAGEPLITFTADEWDRLDAQDLTSNEWRRHVFLKANQFMDSEEYKCSDTV